jgi:hypothetical protein
MARRLLQIVVALALFGAGWVVARAQTPAPDFELVVDAPGGRTNITCVRGCKLMWVERGINPNATATSTFEYGCTAPRCSSARVGGWIGQ